MRSMLSICFLVCLLVMLTEGESATIFENVNEAELIERLGPTIEELKKKHKGNFTIQVQIKKRKEKKEKKNQKQPGTSGSGKETNSAAGGNTIIVDNNIKVVATNGTSPPGTAGSGGIHIPAGANHILVGNNITYGIHGHQNASGGSHGSKPSNATYIFINNELVHSPDGSIYIPIKATKPPSPTGPQSIACLTLGILGDTICSGRCRITGKGSGSCRKDYCVCETSMRKSKHSSNIK